MNLSLKDPTFNPGETLYTLCSDDKTVGIIKVDTASRSIYIKVEGPHNSSGFQEAPKYICNFVREYIAAIYVQGDY